MNFEFVKIKDNGDATSNYDIKGKFPVRFEEFFKTILKEENSFRVVFHDTDNWPACKIKMIIGIAKKRNQKILWSNIKTS